MPAVIFTYGRYGKVKHRNGLFRMLPDNRLLVTDLWLAERPTPYGAFCLLAVKPLRVRRMRAVSCTR